ncbi:MAG: hypothetical protein SFV54_25620 [Bryobacteraceae bacterium]|nr:hypothetical protein [Bryobacteraceae bacterium]
MRFVPAVARFVGGRRQFVGFQKRVFKRGPTLETREVLGMKGLYCLILAGAGVAACLLAETVRFDHVVRNDFFAGFAGNREAFERAMKATEAVLKSDAKHAEALAWHGSGLMQQAGELFRQGDQQKGVALWSKALAEMEEAVAIAPRNVGVRAPRGATLFTASRFAPPQQSRPLLEAAIQDYETILDVQTAHFDKIGVHPKGELLFGLAEGYSRLNDATKARAFFERITRELPGTVYAKRADKWLAGGKLEPAETRCVGCHVAR